MNIYAITILSVLVAEYTLSLIANLLNWRALRPDLPEELVDVYDADAYRRSQEYTRVTTRFGLITNTFDFLLILGFWFAGGFNFLDNIVRGWELGTTCTGVAYIGILLMAQMIISLPFSIYSTFVIEERFGFNRTTASTFIADRLKGLLVERGNWHSGFGWDYLPVRHCRADGVAVRLGGNYHVYRDTDTDASTFRPNTKPSRPALLIRATIFT